MSANQQLEGFSGNITEKIAAHQPDLNEIAASVKRFRAQISSGENRKQNSLIKG